MDFAHVRATLPEDQSTRPLLILIADRPMSGWDPMRCWCAAPPIGDVAISTWPPEMQQNAAIVYEFIDGGDDATVARRRLEQPIPDIVWTCGCCPGCVDAIRAAERDAGAARVPLLWSVPGGIDLLRATLAELRDQVDLGVDLFELISGPHPTPGLFEAFEALDGGRPLPDPLPPTTLAPPRR